MSRPCTNRVLAGCLAALSLVAGAGFDGAQGPPGLKLEDVLQAAQRRQERVRSLHFAWTQRTTDGKGSRTLPPQLQRNRSGEVIPPRDVSYDTHMELWIDGEKMRFAFDDYEWDSKEQACLPCPYVGTFDGKLRKSLHENGGPGRPYPDGYVQAAERDDDAMNLSLLPLLMTYRAADPKMRGEHDLSQMTLTGRQMTIAGHVCRELQLQHPASSLVDQLWVDPARDCNILRYVKMVGQRLGYQINVRYSEDPAAGWAPSGWDFVCTLNDGKLQAAGRVEAVEREINLAISPDTFDIVFPRGTSVVDLAAGRDYIIKPDGTERVIRKEESGLTYDEVLASDSGASSKVEAPFLARWWPQFLAAGIVVALLAFFGVHYRRRRLSQRRIGPPGVR
jgi:hypothetical protein